MTVITKLILGLFLGICFYMPHAAFATDGLPQVIQEHTSIPLKKVGEGTYRKFGFGVYHAILWAPDGVWNADKPYALQLHYLRSLSKDTLADSIVEDIRDQNATDEETMKRWAAGIEKVIPAVQDGDVMVGLIIPNKEGVLFMNGIQIGKINDNNLSKAFLNIWLGADADEDLKKELLGEDKE